MRGGTFNNRKHFAYKSLVYLLFKLNIVGIGELVGADFDPNPLISAQKLFVDPF
jgi:hypothetical protein